MTAFLRRIAYWLGKREREPDAEAIARMNEWMATTSVMVPMPEYDALVSDAEKWRAQYLADFGPNVPVEDLGGKPVGMEKAP